MSQYREIDGVKYPRVTSILSIISKPALYRWYAKHGMKAFDILKDSAKRGSNVHHAIEARQTGHSWEDVFRTVTPEETKYLLGFKKFEEEWTYTPIKKFDQKLVISKEYGYCGELDDYGTLVNKLTKEKYPNILIDYKTGSGIWPEYKLQIAAYWHALIEMGNNADFAGILRLDPSGNYELPFYNKTQLEKFFDVFKDALNLCKSFKEIK